MRRFAFLALVASSLALLSCADEPKEKGAVPDHVLRVAVSADGAISLNGEPASLDRLRSEFAAAAQTGGATVWYYRPAADGEPPAAAMLVIEAIVEHQLPVSLSSEPDFSTVVLPDGTVKPRW